MPVLGLDTSNYITSAALFDGETGRNAARLLDVRPGGLGLRQSGTLFQRVKRLPVLCSGGAASNARLRAELSKTCGAIFAQPRFSAGNAMGTAILTWRAWKAGERP